MPQTSRGLIYPDSSGHTRTWEHWQSLADTSNTALDTVDNRTVRAFDTAAARSTAIPSPIEGMVTWLRDVNRLEVYTGTAWGSAYEDSPNVKVLQTTAQSLPNAAYAMLTFQSALYGSGGMWAAASPSRITFTRPGLYLLAFTAAYVANATGNRFTYFQKNGVAGKADFMSTMGGPASSTVHQNVWSGVGRFVAGDYVEVAAYQNSGAALNTQVGSGFQCIAEATWIRD